MQNLVTCRKCGWVHFAVTRAFAEASVARFNEFYFELTFKEQQDWYGGKQSSLVQYEYCRLCGTHHSGMRPFAKDDCPSGCTIAPIIQEESAAHAAS